MMVYNSTAMEMVAAAVVRFYHSIVNSLIELASQDDDENDDEEEDGQFC